MTPAEHAATVRPTPEQVEAALEWFPQPKGRTDIEGRHGAVLAAEVVRLRTLVAHLFPMIPAQAWRDTGGDDGQGHYEGDYHAERLAEEIRSWGALGETAAVVGVPGVTACADHRSAARCQRDHESGRCICRAALGETAPQPGSCVECGRPMTTEEAIRSDACPTCDPPEERRCGHCDGVGAMAGGHQDRVNDCPYCGGTGREPAPPVGQIEGRGAPG